MKLAQWFCTLALLTLACTPAESQGGLTLEKKLPAGFAQSATSWSCATDAWPSPTPARSGSFVADSRPARWTRSVPGWIR